MFRLRPAALALLLFTLALPVLAVSRTATEIDQNRARLQKIREQEKDRYAQLVEQAQAFLALPAERREQMRQLDQDLHELPPAYRKHLKQVMKKYVTWLSQLPSEQRKQIEQAADAKARLDLIKQLREQQWIGTLAKADRAKLAEMNPAARAKEIARLKKQQHWWQIEWQLAQNHWDALTKFKFDKKKSVQLPEHLADLQPEVRTFAETLLKPRLPADQWQELESAQGQWPRFPYLLVKLADEHPIALPGAIPWPKEINQLPDSVKNRLKKISVDKVLRPLEGQYLAFVGKIAESLDRADLKYDLWPTKQQDLSPPMKNFVKELTDGLTEEESEALAAAKGWPQYPELIQKLADKYYLSVPWQTLPPTSIGNLNLWDTYRIKKGPSGPRMPAP